MACYIPCCIGWKTDAWYAAVGKSPTLAASENTTQFNRPGVRIYANKKSSGWLLLQLSTKSGNLNMHNLEKLIAEWRESAATNVSAEALDELETHVREATEQLVR